MKTKRKNNNKGFTLVEMIVAIGVIAVLAVVVSPQLIGYIEKSNRGTDRQAIWETARAAQIAYTTAEDMEDNMVMVSITEDGNVGYGIYEAGEAVLLDTEVNQVLPEDGYQYKSKLYRDSDILIKIEDGLITISAENARTILRDKYMEDAETTGTIRDNLVTAQTILNGVKDIVEDNRWLFWWVDVDKITEGGDVAIKVLNDLLDTANENFDKAKDRLDEVKAYKQTWINNRDTALAAKDAADKIVDAHQSKHDAFVAAENAKDTADREIKSLKDEIDECEDALDSWLTSLLFGDYYRDKLETANNNLTEANKNYPDIKEAYDDRDAAYSPVKTEYENAVKTSEDEAKKAAKAEKDLSDLKAREDAYNRYEKEIKDYTETIKVLEEGGLKNLGGLIEDKNGEFSTLEGIIGELNSEGAINDAKELDAHIKEFTGETNNEVVEE